MRATTVTCDRCGVVIEGDFLRVGVVAAVRSTRGFSDPALSGLPIKQPYNSYGGALSLREADWCETCGGEIGVSSLAYGNPDIDQKELPTLDELVREIVREEASEVVAEGGSL